MSLVDLKLVGIVLMMVASVSMAQSNPNQRWERERRLFIADPCFGALVKSTSCDVGMDLVGQGTPSGTCCKVKPLKMAELSEANNDPLSPELAASVNLLTKIGEVRNLYPDNGPSESLKNNKLTVGEFNVDKLGERDEIEALFMGTDALFSNKNIEKDEVSQIDKNKKEISRFSNADFIILNEADNDTCRSGWGNDARDYAIAAHMNYAWMPEFLETGTNVVDAPIQSGTKCDHVSARNNTGNAVLSRYPILSVDSGKYLNSKGEPLCHDWHKDSAEPRRGGRGFMIVRIDVPGVGPMSVISTHLENKTSPGCRQSQLRQLGKAIEKLNIKDPMFFGADLNTVSSGNSIFSGHLGGFVRSDSGTVNVLKKELGFNVDGANDGKNTFHAIPAPFIVPILNNTWVRLDWLGVKDGFENGQPVSLVPQNPLTLEKVRGLMKTAPSDHVPIVTDVEIKMAH